MVLLVAIVAVSILVGLLLRGSLRRFEHVRLRWWGLALLGLGLQFVPVPTGLSGTDLLVRVAVLSCSYSLLVLFAALNVRTTGMPLVLIGLLLNAAVVIPNGGMPVSAEAVARSGQDGALEALTAGTTGKHHLMTDDDVLTPLADIIPIPEPIGAIASVGDLVLYLGVAWLIVAVMLGRTPQDHPGEQGHYRGKHRPATGRRAAPDPAPPSPATMSEAEP